MQADSTSGPWRTAAALDGTPLVFATPADAQVFLDKTIGNWGWLRERAGISCSAKLTEFASHLHGQWAGDPEEKSTYNRLSGSLSAVLTFPFPIYPGSDFVDFIDEIAERDPDEAVWTLAWLLYKRGFKEGFRSFRNHAGDPRPYLGISNASTWLESDLRLSMAKRGESNVRDAIQEIARARTEALGTNSEIATILAGVHRQAAEAQSKLLEKLDEADERVQSIEEDLRNRYKTTSERLDVQWQTLINAFDERLGLKAPADYWEKKAKQHKTRTCLFAAASVAVAALGLIGMYFGTRHLFGDLSSSSMPKWSEIILTAVFSVALLWTLKTLVRLTMSNAHLELDADERRVMVLSYLAMVKERETTDNQRTALFTAIFRPTGSGLIAEESPPVPIFELLKKN